MKVTYEFDLNDFKAWGQGKTVLEEIKDAGLVEEAQRYIEDIFGSECDETELNDYLAYEWESLYSAIGMPDDYDEENDDSGDVWDD